MDGIRGMSCYLPPNSAPATECNEERMVKIELEAAEALAGLAQSTVTENQGGDSVMTQGYSEFDSVSGPPNLVEDHGILQQKHHKPLHDSVSQPIKNEYVCEPELNGTCTTSYASSGLGKSKQCTTEAEKEARRVRRVLANRESARQTIRRRQAIFEELTRKAADLAWENENLKREKELAVNEYDSLRSLNETLKTQMTEMLKVDSEETLPEISPCVVENSALLFSNQPAFFPFLWPQMVQHPNSVQIQCGVQGSVVYPSPAPMLVSNELDQASYDKGNFMNTNGSGTPFYLIPYPWVSPLSQHEHHEQMFNLNDKPNENPLNMQYTPCSPLPVNINGETSTSQEMLSTTYIHNNFGFPPDGGGQQVETPRPSGNVLTPVPLRCVRCEVSVEHVKNSNLLNVREVKTINAATERDEPMSGKKVEDVAAAAKARKRRKELTKLKNLSCRQYRSAIC